VGQLYITFTIYEINSVSCIIMPPPYFVAAAVDTWLLTLVLTYNPVHCTRKTRSHRKKTELDDFDKYLVSKNILNIYYKMRKEIRQLAQNVVLLIDHSL
jgi:hypothetical protein